MKELKQDTTSSDEYIKKIIKFKKDFGKFLISCFVFTILFLIGVAVSSKSPSIQTGFIVMFFLFLCVSVGFSMFYFGKIKSYKYLLKCAKEREKNK